MRKLDAPHLEVIRASLTAIAGCRPADKVAFLESPLLQDAILMRLQVIGENLAAMRRIDESRFAEAIGDTGYQVIGLRSVISMATRRSISSGSG